jgi:hypothetical protein
MPKFVDKGRSKCKHSSPKFAQHAPHLWSKPVCGQKAQHAPTDTSSLLDKKRAARVQGVSSAFLCHGRAVDCTVLPALNEISNNQARPTEITSKACDHLVDCLATHPDAVICFCASGTCLCVVSDAACLVSPDARSRRAGLFFSVIIPRQLLLRQPPMVPFMSSAKPLVVFLLLQLKPKQLASS